MARILLVDDNVDFRSVAGKILRRAGHDVVEVADGAEALTLYRVDPADLVITDVYMPGTDGIETTIRLSQEFPSVRIIVASGGGTVERGRVLEIAERLGAIRTLAKPFGADELLAAVDAALHA